jgi:hypothetical protein
MRLQFLPISAYLHFQLLHNYCHFHLKNLTLNNDLTNQLKILPQVLNKSLICTFKEASSFSITNWLNNLTNPLPSSQTVPKT